MTAELAVRLRAVAEDRARQLLDDGFHHGVRFEPSVNRPQQEGLVQALALLQACTEMIADLQQTADAAAARAHAKGASYAEIGTVRGTSRQAARQRHQKRLAEQKERREAWQAPRQDERWPPPSLRLRALAGQWTVTLSGGPLDSQILRVPVGDDAYPFVGYTDVFGRRQPRHARYSPAKPGDNRYQFTGEFFIGTLDASGAAARERERTVGASGKTSQPATTYRPGPTGGLPSSTPSPPPQPHAAPSSPRQPHPGPVRRVHELAAELSVDSKTVLATLQSIGAFVKSASSTVDAATAHRLRHELRSRTARTATPASPPHHRDPRPGKRVYELAAEFGVPSKTVIAMLAYIGYHVVSAASTVEAPIVQRLRDEVRNPTPGTNPRSGMTHPLYGLLPASPFQQHSGERADEVPEAPLTGLAKTLRGTFPQIQTDEEARHLAARWSDHLFTEEDMVTWCRHGLTPHDYATARQLDSYGIRPHHLELVIQGNAVKTLLRGGRSITWVAGLLRQGGYIDTP
jgi:hypothetical protein